MENIYLPRLMVIKEIIKETSDTKTFKLKFQSEEQKEQFNFKPGQFGLFSAFGQGEAPFCIVNSSTRKGHIECSVKKVGKVTTALHKLNAGDTMGFRGPYGNHFPIDKMRGKNLIFVGGGMGLASLRPLLWNCLHKRKNFKNIAILYGARTTADLVYRRELKEWMRMEKVDTILTVDPGGEDEDWKGEIGFVPTILEKMNPSPQNAIVIICGPSIMAKLTLKALEKLGFTPDQIILSLEMKMKCGLGKCGRCNIGHVYTCKYGPIFSYEQLKKLPPEY